MPPEMYAPKSTRVVPEGSLQGCCRSGDSLALDCRFEAEKHALEQAPNEACGLVVNGRYWPCRNIADEPELDFAINPVDYARAALSGKIEAVVHSHPMGGPASPADLRACRVTGLAWHIYLIPEGKWSTIKPC